MTNKLTSLRLPDDVRAWLRQRSVDLDTTLVGIVSAVVRERMAAEPAGPTCPVCSTQRFPNHPDAMYDSLAHAQCDQRMADLERGAES